MTNAILEYELLNDNLLDLVAGGTTAETNVDISFFMQLDYDMAEMHPVDAFEENGVQFTTSGSRNDNKYKIKMNGKWCAHPHWAALGYVLAKRNYPGFTGNWTDSAYVHSFLKNNFNITELG